MQPNQMIREILTLLVDKIPVSYYIEFEKERRWFRFQPTLKNKTAPSFTMTVQSGEIVCNLKLEDSVSHQAIEKVNEILSNNIFDQL